MMAHCTGVDKRPALCIATSSAYVQLWQDLNGAQYQIVRVRW
jgi:hypothetical protein